MCGGWVGEHMGDIVTAASIAMAPFTGGLSLIAAPMGMQMSQQQDAMEQQKDQLREQKKAQQEAQSKAIQQERQSQMAINAANRRQPNVAGIMQTASQQAAGGPSGTMLTGPMGIDMNQTALGKNTLLGS